MREKTKCTRWFRYTIEDAKAAQAELDQRAEQGWELEEVGLFTATFRRAEHPRPCWVEPARWKSWSEKDENSRADYLALCGEAGWELLSEDGGLFYFRAREGTDPAPIQTDAGVEWEDVWKKALADQAWNLLYIAVSWAICAIGRYLRDQPRLWELFLSNLAMAAQLLLLLWLGIDLFLGLRVVFYRKRCRRAAEEGESFPVPRRAAARLRGASSWIFWVVLAVSLAVLLTSTDYESRFLTDGSGYTRESHSVLGDYREFLVYDERGNRLWVERADCRTSWLADWICGDFRASEGDAKRVRREVHPHDGAVIPREAELGFDKAWIYSIGEYSGLILRDGDQVARIEAEGLDLTGAETLGAIRAWLAESPDWQPEAERAESIRPPERKVVA